MEKICQDCGIDHSIVMKCRSAKGGRHPKGTERMRAMANVRWKKYREDKAAGKLPEKVKKTAEF